LDKERWAPEEWAIIQRAIELGKTSSIDLDQVFFEEQKVFKNDKALYKAALCTRRAGKSYLAASLLVESAITKPGTTSLYIALTRASAKNILWSILPDITKKLGLTVEFNETDLQAKFENGSIIWLVGADTKNFISRLLGGKYPRAIIDEAQSFREHIKRLVDDVLSPALLDYRGDLILLGTPGPTPSGYFYEVTEKREHGFSVHKWSVMHNPHLEHAPEFIESMLQRKGWTRDNPTFRREWLGQWVEDPDALVYKFRIGTNEYQTLPPNYQFYRILGVDYGWNDKTAFSIVTYSPNLRDIFVEHAEAQSEMIPSQIAAKVQDLIRRYAPIKIVADTGGLGKSITEEMIRRYSIPIHPAQKTEKMTAISILNGEFIDRHLFVHSSLDDLKKQYHTLSKNDLGQELAGQPNDLCDAVLYATREARAYAYEPLKPKTLTKEEVWKEEEAEILRRLEESVINKKMGEWWEK